MISIIKLLLEIPLYYFSGLIKRKKNRIIFGAWHGEKYSDNSKYMFEYLLGKKDFELIWCGKKKIEENIPRAENIKFVYYGSLRSYYYALTSKYAFVTHGYNDIIKINLFKGAKLIQLWHGIGIKNIGELSFNENSIKFKIRKKIRNIIRKYDYFLCTSKANQERNMIAFKSYGINEQNIIKSGQPRNSILINYNDNDVNRIKNTYYKQFCIPTDKKIITYLPTFRKTKQNTFHFFDLSNSQKKKLFKILKKHDAIIIQKVHNSDFTNIKKHKNDNISNYVYFIDNQINIDVQELLLISDILITDYSSCFIDYVLLNKPIIHFIYDYVEYIEINKGLYFDLYDIAAGDIVFNEDELINSIEKNIINKDSNKTKREFVKKKMMEYENGNSCETICKEVGILNEK